MEECKKCKVCSSAQTDFNYIFNSFRSNGNVTLAFNNQLSRGRTGNYDVHLQPTGPLLQFPMAASYQTLSSPATKQVSIL
jgi:hypothetical protein